MKNVCFASLMLILFSSCNIRVYTTSSNADAISNIPIEAKEKGDASAEVLLGVYGSSDYYTYSDMLRESILYRKLSAVEGTFGGYYAITDALSLGTRYKIAGGNEDFQSHSIAGSVNYFKNYPTKKGKAVYGYDVMGTFQYKTTKNFMGVDEGIINLYYFVVPVPSTQVFIDIEGGNLSYYKIRQNLYRFIVQPSFSVDHKWVRFFIGGAAAVQHQFRYNPELDQQFVDYVIDTDKTNPMVYYKNRRADLLGSVFLGLGFGPEFCRLTYKYSFGWSTDKMDQRFYGFNFGLTSNFHIDRKNIASTNSGF